MESEPENSIEFGDLLSVYPDIDEEDFARKLSSRVEFFRLKENVKVEKGDLFPHQKIIERFFSRVTPYESLMLFWPPGRGKTRATLQIAKMFIDYPNKFSNEFNNQKILIISKKSVLPVWPDQMKLMPEYRQDKFDKPAATDTSAKRQLTIVVSKYADIVPQDHFANELEEMSDEAIRLKYSRPLIIIDEVHFLRTIVESVYDDNGIIKDTGHDAGGKYRDKKTFIQIRRLFQLAVGSLKIILTGTPMFDKPEELVSITSFILPDDKQMTVAGFRQAYSGGSQSLLEYLEPRLRGMISFVSEDRGTAPFIKKGKRLQVVIREGQQEKVVEYKIRVKGIKMTERQTRLYRIYRGEEEVEEGEDIPNDETFYIRSRKALNNIFIHPRDPRQDTLEMEYFFEGPGYASNKNGFVEIYPPKTKTQKEKDEDRKKQKEAQLKKLEQKATEERTGRKTKKKDKESSTKSESKSKRFMFRFKNEYENMIMDMPDGTKKKVEPYKVLAFGDPLPPARMELVRLMSAKAHWIINNIYNKWMFPGEGEVTFIYHPFVNEGGGIPLGMFFEFVGFQRFVGEEDTSMISAIPDIPRFAYLTGSPGATASQIRAIRNVISSPENIYGRKILAAIASEVVATGWTFANFRKFMHYGPNFKLYRQARGRTNRLDSHVNFPTEDRKFVKVYLLAGVTSDGEETVDHYSWRRVEEKEKRIRLPAEICKKISFDCYLNSKSGRREISGKGGEVGEKLPSCIGSTVDIHGRKLPPLPLDYSTYHLHWASEEFEEIDFKIRRLFKISSSYTLSEIVQSIPEHNNQTIIWTLTQMLNRKEFMTDRFGYTRILRENNGVYYLDNNISMPKDDVKPAFTNEIYDDTLAQYTRNLVVAAPQNFHSVTRNMDKKIRAKIPDFVTLKQRWNIENSEIRMQLLERAILNDDIHPDIRRFILDDLRTVWFMHEGCVFHYYDQSRVRSAGGHYQANFNRIGDDSSIRFVCKGERTFRPAEGFVQQRYIKIINDKLHSDKQRYLKKVEDAQLPFLPIFNKSSDGNFRILQLAKRRLTTKGEIDQRSDRGEEHKSFTYQALVEYAWLLDIPNPIEPLANPGRQNDNHLRAEIRNFVGTNVSIDDWPREKLEFYFGWMQDKLPAPISLDLEEVFGEDVAFEMSKFLSPNDFSYDVMLRRYIFLVLRERDLILVR